MMQIFNAGFISVAFPSTEKELSAACTQAFNIVHAYNAQEETVAACYKRIEACFSSQVRKSDCIAEGFLQGAHEELYFRAAECRIKKTPPIIRILPSVSFSVGQDVSCYLERYLHDFMLITRRQVQWDRSFEEVKKTCGENLQEFFSFCDQYKEKAESEGRKIEKIDELKCHDILWQHFETRYACQNRHVQINEIKNKATGCVQDILAEAEKVYSDPLCAHLPLHIACHGALLDKDHSSWEMREAINCFVYRSPYEDDPEIYQRKVKFFLEFFESTKEFLSWRSFWWNYYNFSHSLTPDWVEFFTSLPSDEETKNQIQKWACSSEVQQRVAEFQLQPEYEKAENFCLTMISGDCYLFLLKLCKTPLQVKRLLDNLTRDLITKLQDESVLKLLGSAFRTERVVELAWGVKLSISVIEHMRSRAFCDTDIESFLSFCSPYICRDIGFQAHTELLALSQEQLASIVNCTRSCEKEMHGLNACRPLLYVLCGGTLQLWQRVEKIFYYFPVTKKTIAALASLSEAHLQKAEQLSLGKPSGWMREEDVVKLVMTLRNEC
jgi:hypothetical protein